jgi:hypothetical protein
MSDTNATARKRLGCILQVHLISRRDRQIAARIRQRLAESQTDTTAGARHDRNLALQCLTVSRH